METESLSSMLSALLNGGAAEANSAPPEDARILPLEPIEDEAPGGICGPGIEVRTLGELNWLLFNPDRIPTGDPDVGFEPAWAARIEEELDAIDQFFQGARYGHVYHPDGRPCAYSILLLAAGIVRGMGVLLVRNAGKGGRVDFVIGGTLPPMFRRVPKGTGPVYMDGKRIGEG